MTKLNNDLINKTDFIVNTKNNSTDKTYNCDYINKKLEYDKTHISTATITNGTLASANLDIRLREDNKALKPYGFIDFQATYIISRATIATGLSNLVDNDTSLNNIAILQDTTDSDVKQVLNGIISSNGDLSMLLNPVVNGHSYKICFMNNEIEL